MATSTTITGRSLSDNEQTIVQEVLTLYQLNPTDKSYSHYAPTAVFHDPVSIAKGLDSVKSQFNGMPKVFDQSITKKCEALESPSNKIILDLTQHYVFKGEKTPEKTVNSKITLTLNGAGLIEQHDEEWDHEPNKDGSDGFFGKLNELRKKATAKLVDASVTSDPNKV